MENGVDWHNALCIMAILLGAFSGGVGVLEQVDRATTDARSDRAQPRQQAAITDERLQLGSDGLLLTHAAAMVVSGGLALRARRHGTILRVVFRAGIPVVILGQAWSFSRHGALRSLLVASVSATSRLAFAIIVLSVVWSLSWSALKIGFFFWGDRYLGRSLSDDVSDSDAYTLARSESNDEA
jgi:hypothetical protein